MTSLMRVGLKSSLINIKDPCNPKVKMIITFSYGGVKGKAFKIDRFASKYRKESSIYNNKKTAGKDEYLQSIIGNEFLKTNSPFDKMYIAGGAMDFLEKAQFKVLKSGVSLRGETIGRNVSSPPYDTSIIKFPNVANYNPYNGLQIDSIDPISGSGGGFLSNEIYYRVSFLRNKHNPNLKTGHIHVGFNHGDESASNRNEMITIISKAIKEAIKNL